MRRQLRIAAGVVAVAVAALAVARGGFGRATPLAIAEVDGRIDSDRTHVLPPQSQEPPS